MTNQQVFAFLFLLDSQASGDLIDPIGIAEQANNRISKNQPGSV
jgi:hypothetical protein